jgi:plastocyanin
VRRTALAVALGAALAAALALPAAAQMPMGHDMGSQTTPASILFETYQPPHIDVVAGDTVMWRNDSIRRHTVTAVDRSWTSSTLVPTQTFMRTFDAPGDYQYFCTIHPLMHGEVDVHRVLLEPTPEPGATGAPYTLSGRAALPVTDSVSIEADEGAGFVPVDSTTVADDGSFRVTVTPRTTTRYRAVLDGQASPPVQVLVLDRNVALATAQHGRSTALVADVTPASPGATVVLQLHLRNRFGWWPVRRARLSAASRARFVLRLTHRVRARVLLTQADGATQLARSPVVRVGRAAPRRSR